MDIKSNPRKWSSKYWQQNDISDVLKEVIEPEAVDVSTIKMNDRLCSMIWESDEKLKPEVREVLLKNAKRFIEFSDVEGLKFNDIVLTGSLANYNYTEDSDVDVHIIMDFNQISENKIFVGEFLMLKKALWAEKLPIQVKGHDVEMYFQDANEPHHSSGVYSLAKDKWIRKPIKKIVNVDMADVQLKAADLINNIDELEDDKDSEEFLKKYEQLKNKIRKYRQTGLDSSGGEFSVENLVFKILRHSGFLKKMTEMKNEYLVDELTLDEINE
jgi:predicted nucleotidyltransferase